MKFQVKPTDALKVEADMLAVFAGDVKRVDTALSGHLTQMADMEGFENKVGKTFLIHTSGKLPTKSVLLVGTGEVKKLTPSDVLKISAAVGSRAKASGAKHLAISIATELFDAFPTAKLLALLTEGITLGTYVFIRHKSEETRQKEKVIDTVTFLVSANKIVGAAEGMKHGETVAEAVCFARDLVNEPSSVTTPSYLADVAKNITKGQTKMSCKIIDRETAKKLGMGAFLGVAQGSEEEPKFIHLTYKGGGRKTVTLVGKGITFDSGGLSLKSSSGMETMKSDMAGGAAILGIFHVLARLKPTATVIGLIAATENMPSGKALKPGDIVTAANGKTIEVLNTDAEGRLILADALSYASSFVKPDVMIDLATLTYACQVALGEEIAGLFSNRPTLSSQLLKSAKDAGEPLWEMPLTEDYKEALKSTVADMKNVSGGKYGGAITAALFLSEFVPPAAPWAHLDIAGPAFAEKGSDLNPKGGTGFGVRMILNYLLTVSG